MSTNEALPIIELDQLATVSGGFDVNQAIEAGNRSAPAGREAGKYLGPAIVRAQDAITKGEVVELIDDIDRRISSRVLRRALFSAARDVVGVDDEVTPEEGSLLAEIAVRFG